MAAALKPPLPDPARHGQARVAEELVQGAQRHVVGGGDHRGRQLGVARMPLDERLDRGEGRMPARLGRPPVGSSSSCASLVASTSSAALTAAPPRPGCNDQRCGPAGGGIARPRPPRPALAPNQTRQLLIRPRVSGSSDGGNMNVTLRTPPFWPRPGRSPRRGRGVLKPRTRPSTAAPAWPSCSTQAGAAAAHQHQLQHVRVGRYVRPECGSHGGRECSMTTTCIGPRPLARELPWKFSRARDRAGTPWAPTSWPS